MVHAFGPNCHSTDIKVCSMQSFNEHMNRKKGSVKRDGTATPIQVVYKIVCQLPLMHEQSIYAAIKNTSIYH